VTQPVNSHWRFAEYHFLGDSIEGAVGRFHPWLYRLSASAGDADEVIAASRKRGNVFE
jgi:hypothetical protein